MLGFIKALQLIAALIPAVKAAEEAIPIPKKGKEKLDMILNATGATAEVAQTVVPVISAIVSSFNKAGVFTTTKEGE